VFACLRDPECANYIDLRFAQNGGTALQRRPGKSGIVTVRLCVDPVDEPLFTLQVPDRFCVLDALHAAEISAVDVSERIELNQDFVRCAGDCSINPETGFLPAALLHLTDNLLHQRQALLAMALPEIHSRDGLFTTTPLNIPQSPMEYLDPDQVK
jgi:hypothetical protein